MVKKRDPNNIDPKTGKPYLKEDPGNPISDEIHPDEEEWAQEFEKLS